MPVRTIAIAAATMTPVLDIGPRAKCVFRNVGANDLFIAHTNRLASLDYWLLVADAANARSIPFEVDDEHEASQKWYCYSILGTDLSIYYAAKAFEEPSHVRVAGQPIKTNPWGWPFG